MFNFGRKNKAKSAPAEEDSGKLSERLSGSRKSFGDRIKSALTFSKQLDDDLFEELETLLLMADIGSETTMEIIDELTGRTKRKELRDPQQVMAALRSLLIERLKPYARPLIVDPEKRPCVVLVVGVNGVGKTTTIGKMARRCKDAGLSVMLAAGDTFRAAAVEQLKEWGERNGIPVVAQATGADSASVIYDAMESAKARGVQILLADTAGRLHTKSNLMEELKKVKRVMSKLDPGAPHEVLMVIDGNTGQNALNQAQQFSDAIKLTGLAVTKLDGTARGGMLFSLTRKLGLPIRFIGVGEKIGDLRHFDAEEFVDALLGEVDAE